MRVPLIVSALVVLGVTSLEPQALRTVDPSTLERPKPVCSLSGDQIRPTLEFVISTLVSSGFMIDTTDWDAGEAVATKADASGENKVIVWLEWDVRRPKERINVYLATGRFEKFVGAATLRRVLLTTTEERQHFGSVKTALITEAIKRG